MILNRVVFLLCAFCLAVPAAAETDLDSSRLWLKDRAQEILTTSVNWPDLPVDPRPVRVADLTVSDVWSEPANVVEKPRSFRIVVDAGHGGKDNGAQGIFGSSEKAICLRIGRLVRETLKRLGISRKIPLEIKLSRDEDAFISLRDRVRIANDWGADLFVSVHANWSPYARVHGFEVYFLSAEASDAQAHNVATFENDVEIRNEPLKADVLSILSDVQATQHVTESSSFAESVYQSLSRNFRPNGRGVRQAPFTVLAGTTMPALLVEVGYVTNPEEAKNLSRSLYLRRLASAISTGIIQFLTRHPRVG